MADMQEWAEKHRVCMAKAKLEKTVETRLMFGTFLESQIQFFSLHIDFVRNFICFPCSP
jgi:hypothetical protein